MSEVFLSVIIPSYDEMANLRKGVLERVQNFLKKKKYSYEVIIVDDGSRDGSVEFVKNFIKENKLFRLIENKHLGKAGAVTTGMLAAKGQYRIFTDVDQATPIEEIDSILPFLAEKGFGVAIGSRSKGEMGYPLSRLFMHNAMIVLRKTIVGLSSISDTQCGFKMFRKDAAEVVFSKLQTIHHGFREISNSAVQAGFDIETLLIAEANSFKIAEVPVEWLYVESRRISPVKDSLEGFINLLSIRKNIWKGIYG